MAPSNISLARVKSPAVKCGKQTNFRLLLRSNFVYARFPNCFSFIFTCSAMHSLLLLSSMNNNEREKNARNRVRFIAVGLKSAVRSLYPGVRIVFTRILPVCFTCSNGVLHKKRNDVKFIICFFGQKRNQTSVPAV